MSAKISLALSVGLIFIAGVLCARSASAQDASAPSLADELKAKYKLAKIVPESNGYKVAEPGTMLIIQKEGIVGVPLGSNSVEPVIYAIHKDADLHHSTASPNTWKFGVGHKVYLSKLDIDAKHEKVLFTIVECDSSDLVKPAYYKSVVDFEFPNGYLAAADAGQIEDVISQVLTIDIGTKEAQQHVTGGEISAAGLPNEEIIKLVQAKLPDSVVIAKIKSSSSEFDTSTDALIKLKKAGASDLVLQAIVDAQARSVHSDPVENSPTAGANKQPDVTPACSNYDSCVRIAQALLESSQWDRALSRFQEASELDPSRGDTWAGMGSAYFQMGQYDDAVRMWDKALRLGSSLSMTVRLAKTLCCDNGTFQLSAKEVSFVNKKGEKEFAAAPSAVSSEGAVFSSNGYAFYYLQIRDAGKNHRFVYLPKDIGCNMGGIVCPEPGSTQQKIFGDYVHQTLVRMAAGDFRSQPNKP
jgi:tetratricopeptide (TPR) repeat protein